MLTHSGKFLCSLGGKEPFKTDAALLSVALWMSFSFLWARQDMKASVETCDKVHIVSRNADDHFSPTTRRFYFGSLDSA